MKDLGTIHYCLGITIDYDQQKGCLLMHQKQYIHNLLEKYGLSEAKPSKTPSNVSVKLTKDDGVSKTVDQINYQSMVGSLLYAATATRLIFLMQWELYQSSTPVLLKPTSLL